MKTLGKSVIELVTSLGAPRAETRLAALDALIAQPAPGAWAALVGCLADPEVPVRVRAAEALALLPPQPASLRALRTAAHDPARSVRQAARAALEGQRAA